MSETSVEDHPPEELLLAAESLPEHLELNHYVEIYRRSAERARYIVVTIMVFSVVVVVAQWNSMDYSWTAKRYHRLAAIHHAAGDNSSPDAFVQHETRGRYKSIDGLGRVLDEFAKIRAERVYMFEVPGVGIALDINDLGLFSGIAYALLLLLLLFALIREYENLYLALFKVRHLHDHGKTTGGESTANYLYHALAMSQVFNAPPTLAQWRPSVARRNIPNIVFITPVLVQAYVVYTNYRTGEVLRWFQLLFSDEMVPQYILLGLVMLLAALSAIYADAANYRWRSAFLHVNPGLNHVDSVPWTTWVRFRFFRKRLRGHLQRRMWAQVVQKLTLASEAITRSIPVSHTLHLRGRRISFDDVREMCATLQKHAEDAADQESVEYRLVRTTIKSSVLHNQTWTVTAEIHASFAPKNVS